MTEPDATEPTRDPWPGSGQGSAPQPPTPQPPAPPSTSAYPQPGADPGYGPLPPPAPGLGFPPGTPAGANAYGRFEPLPPATTEPVKSRRTLATVAGLAVLVVAAIAVAVGVSASGGQVDAHAVIKTTTEPTAGLGTLVHSHGVTIDLPPNWTNLPTSPAELKAAAKLMSAKNPLLAKSISQLSTSQVVDHFAIFAVRARTDPSAPLENLEVVVASAGTLTLDAFALGVKATLASAGATRISSTSATLGNLPAFRVDYTLAIKTATGTQLVVAVSFGVIENGNAASIIFSNQGDGVDVKSIADSFTFG